jgi:class 3 adenylate cyclase/tetratricopeptide (TPR) repeat protein/transcriptional regulator with XRE-family HTH domain
MAQVPSGTVTFLFTDIEGSTTRWEQHPQAMRAALARHDVLLQAGITAHGGVVVTERGEGDSFFALFARPSDALAAACALQHALVAEPWPPEVAPLRVRMALHTGEAGLRAGADYRGAAVNRCARLRAVAHGGQVLLSGATYELVRDALPPEVGLRDLGEHRLKDLTRPEHIFQALIPDLPTDFPPLKSLDQQRHNRPVQPTAMSGQEGPAFGALLRRYRKVAGLTQEQLAERALLSVFTISALERGANHAPRKDTLALLAEALGLSPSERAALGQAAHVPAAAPASPSPEAVAAAPLVGRQPDLALLERHLAGDGPPVLLLAGEPGIGKSRLLRDVGEQAARAGWTVLAGGCTRRGGQDPYAPLTEALQQPLRAYTEPDVLRGCAWLVRLLPELADGPIEPLPAWALTPAQERRLMFAAVGRYLTNLAGPAGTLLVLDDLQWAGPDALDLLLSLLRVSPAFPLRLVGAYRDTEVPAEAPLAAALADLAQAGLVRHHALEPLSAAAVDQLLAAELEGVAGAGSAVRARLARRAGGVPFFVLSCAQALRLSGGQAPGVEAVPWDVAQGIRQRVAALTPSAREVLGVSSVLGRVVQPAELIAVAEQPQEAVLAALEAAEQARLLVAEGRTYLFAHDLIRDTVEADVGAARRLVLHRRVAEVLAQEAAPCPLERVAFHYGRSDAPGKAIPYLEQAGDQARRQAAYAAAEGSYRAALEGLGEWEIAGHSGDAARLQAKLGELLCLAGRFSEALRELDRAAATYRATGEMEPLADVLWLAGRAQEQRGTPEDGLRDLREAVALVEEQGPSRALAVVSLAQAWLLNPLGRYQEQRAVAERAVELARALGDDLLLARALYSCGVALRFLEPGAEERSYQEAARLAEACGDVETLSGALYHLAIPALLTGDFERAMALSERSLRLRERFGDRVAAAHVIAVRGLINLYRGEWREAEADLRQALQLSREADTALLAALALTFMGYLRVLQGRGRAARRCLADAAALADTEMTALGRRVRAELDLMEERPAAARAGFAPLLSSRNGNRIDNAFILPSLAWAEFQLGDLQAAATTVAEGVTLARAERNNLALADALRVQARVAVEQQAWAEAVQELEEGLALVRRIRYPFVEARLLQVYGELYLQTGEPEAAREHRQAALAIFRQLGARKDVEYVEQAIAICTRGGAG